GQQVEVDQTLLSTLELTAEPLNDKRRDTWRLLDILGSPGAGDMQSITLISESDEELELSAEQLLDESRLHLIKRNRQEQFHYRGWTLGPEPMMTTELRNLREIKRR
ncbi:MAG TPA: hypothetical protein VML75_10960, partial [Kofleriaceae bacterium]|nr:hypothetical protein [Kofleriaceae bacterium]